MIYCHVINRHIFFSQNARRQVQACNRICSMWSQKRKRSRWQIILVKKIISFILISKNNMISLWTQIFCIHFHFIISKRSYWRISIFRKYTWNVKIRLCPFVSYFQLFSYRWDWTSRFSSRKWNECRFYINSIEFLYIYMCLCQ